MDPKVAARRAIRRYPRHVLVEPKSRTRMIATDEILAAFRENVTQCRCVRSPRTRAAIVGPTGGGKIRRVAAAPLRPKTGDPLQVLRTLAQAKGCSGRSRIFSAKSNTVTRRRTLFGTQQAFRNLGSTTPSRGRTCVRRAHGRTTGNIRWSSRSSTMAWTSRTPACAF